MVGGEEEGFAIVLDFVAEAAGDDVIDLEGLDGGAADFYGLGNVAGVPVALALIGGAAVGMADRNVRPAGSNLGGGEIGGHHGEVDRVVDVGDVGDLAGEDSVVDIEGVEELIRAVEFEIEFFLALKSFKEFFLSFFSPQKMF